MSSQRRLVTIAEHGNGFVVLIDGKAARTPKGNPLALPTHGLGEAIAAEWRTPKPKPDPKRMRFTRLANSAIDLVERDALVEQTLKYGVTDLLLYRGEEPVLAARQQHAWDPLLDWVRERLQAQFIVSTGITPVDQPRETLERLHVHLKAMDPFALIAVSSATTITASLILALAMAEGHLSAGEAFALSQIDERYQAERWGLDHAAESRAQAMSEELQLAADFLALSRS